MRGRGALMALLLSTGAWTSPAPDIVLYCTPALQAPLQRIAEAFTRIGHVPVHLFISPPDGVVGLVRHRARADVVVADAVTMDRLVALRLMHADTRTALGRNPFVLVAGAAAVIPSGSTAAGLLAGRAVVLPDATTAASFDGAAVLGGVGTPRAVIGVADTPAVIAAIRENSLVLGLVSRSEASAPGITIAAPLPVAPAAIEAGLVAGGQSGRAAALLRYIAGPDGEAVLRAAGVENGS